MRHREHRAVEALQPLLERLRAVEVEVVGGLVEQQHRRAGQLQQQDLQPGLLAAGQGVEDLVGLAVQLVALQDADRLRPVEPAAAVVAAVQHVHQGLAVEVRLLVRLGEPARFDPRAEPGAAGVGDRLTGEQTQEVRLAAAVGAEHGQPLAVEDLEVERLHQPGQLEPLAGQRAHAGAAALQAHDDLLVDDLLRRRTGLDELGQPGLHGGELGRHRVTDLRLHPQRDDQLAQPLALLVPALVQLLEAVPPRLPGGAVVLEATAVHPGAVRLDRDDAGRGAGQQLTVVADEQDRLRRLGQGRLEPALAGHVEVVVRLVEQQHLVGPAQQRLQRQTLLLTAGQRVQPAVLRLVVRNAEGGDGAGVPHDLGVVAVRVGPVGQRGGVAQLGLGVLGLHHRQLGGVQRQPGGAHPGGGQRQQQVAHGGLVPDRADELAHHPDPARARDRTGVRREVAGDHLQQGGLAGAVRADQRGLGAVTDPEAHVGEQHPAVRQHAGQLGDVDVAHRSSVAVRASGLRIPQREPERPPPRTWSPRRSHRAVAPHVAVPAPSSR